jgi:ribulose-5-phosphate 4-epimerase/fuculose-1-phosphate aldolase
MSSKITMNGKTDDGYIKFSCDFLQSSAIPSKDIVELNKWRDKLYSLRLIGAYENGIGYGNISVRKDKNTFLITGSATGNFSHLTGEHYSEVIDYDINKNYLKCEGPLKASSESMTHAAIYSIDNEINAVIHIHNLKLWEYLLNKVPTASKDAAYGTPEIAREMIRLFNDEQHAGRSGIIVTEGHKEGVFTFGRDIDTAGKILMKYFNKL